MSVKAKCVLCYCLVGVYAIALIPWPLACLFTAAFGFDDPHGPGLLGFYALLSVWLYPGYVTAGLLLGRRSAKRDQPAPLVALKSSIPLLSAMWYAVVLIGGGIAWECFTAAHYHRRFVTAPAVYSLGEGRFAVQNYQGWFTDYKGFNMRHPEPFSAWVVDLSKEVPDKANRIYLREENLERYFFRDRDRRATQESVDVAAWTAAGHVIQVRWRRGGNHARHARAGILPHAEARLIGRYFSSTSQMLRNRTGLP